MVRSTAALTKLLTRSADGSNAGLGRRRTPLEM